MSAPSTTLSVSPTATDGTTITASDENTRNSAITTTFNNHTHIDIDQVNNTLNVGDGTASNKTIQANTADVTKPYLKYDDTNDQWISSHNFAVGDGTAGNKLIRANNADGTKPFIEYDDTNDRWVVSRDGSEITSLVVTTGSTGSSFIMPQTPTFGDHLLYNGVAWRGTSALYKSGNFSRDMTAASSSQSVTGVGFKPTFIIFIGAKSSSSTALSFGFDAGGANQTSIYGNGTAGNFVDDPNASIRVDEGGGARQTADLSTFDSDGFTVSWTKTGSPSGTATVQYIAFR